MEKIKIIHKANPLESFISLSSNGDGDEFTFSYKLSTDINNYISAEIPISKLEYGVLFAILDRAKS